ncbi:MAG: HAD family hydrolase [Nitrospiria bacterium]
MNLIGLDLDGTLEDSRRDMVASVHRVRARFALSKRVDDEIAPWVNQGMETLYRNCFDDYLKKEIEPALLNEVQRAYEEDYLAHVACETRLYPEIAETLEDLSKLALLVVVTNKPEKVSRSLLQALAIDRYMSSVVGGDTCGEIKPSPVLLRAAAKLCGFDPASGRSFMIGDTGGDIKMGRAYGATTIWCAWGYSKQPGEEPDFIARTPKDLPAMVRSVLSPR